MTTYLKDTPPLRFKLRPVERDGSLADHRDSTRHTEFLVGALILSPGQPPVPCMLRDCSTTGGRFEIEKDRARPHLTANDLPARVTVYFCPFETEVEGRIVWRDGRHFGVRYIGEPHRRKAAPTNLSSIAKKTNVAPSDGLDATVVRSKNALAYPAGAKRHDETHGVSRQSAASCSASSARSP